MTGLPAGFAELEPWVTGWALASSAQRSQRRTASTADERQAFYDAMTPRLGEALELLDRKPFSEHDAAERNLINLCLTTAHIALAVEAQGEVEARHALHREAMRITRTPADA